MRKRTTGILAVASAALLGAFFTDAGKDAYAWAKGSLLCAIASSACPEVQEKMCNPKFYGLWLGTWTTETSETKRAKYTIERQEDKIAVLYDLQGNPHSKTCYAECSTDDLTFSDGSTVVQMTIQGPDDLSGLVKDADGKSRGEIELHRSADSSRNR